MGLGLCVLDREAREEMKAERNEGWAVKIWTRTSVVGMDIQVKLRDILKTGMMGFDIGNMEKYKSGRDDDRSGGHAAYGQWSRLLGEVK